MDNPDIYVTRSGRRSKPPERLIYDANSCLIRSNKMKIKRHGVSKNYWLTRHQQTQTQCIIIKL